ncbi:transcriptional regulator, TetR family [Desulfitobacterium hafniense DP7]|uniref:Transcriptional regulator, TetR family n=1 Tax=Desulfitobacterium hafniense DP7 TaxID=537010 RepID=G9XGS0_DESHA|nr:TetR/AcrR family transcriptional regulator [Desulfitobacterium hafniense]EHL09105.1 transcriptional regulator, TetR family [Desulfitobacterium hafniense DP7]
MEVITIAKAEENRAKILEAAQKIVSEKGVYNSSLRTIAEEAGVSTGTLYYYYKSKDLLLSDLMNYLMNGPQWLSHKIKSNHLSNTEIVDNLMLIFQERIQNSQFAKLYLYLAQEAILGNKELCETINRQIEDWITHIEEVLAELLNIPLGSTTRSLAVTLESISQGLIIQHLLGMSRTDENLILDLIRKSITQYFHVFSAIENTFNEKR